MLIVGIVLLIVFGILLLVLELFIVPGLVAGISSVILLISGISIAFIYKGTQAGIITLLITLLAIAIVIYYAFKPKTWNKLALTEEVESKAFDISFFNEIERGDTGITISRMAPIGEIEVKGYVFEAISAQGFIDAGTIIEVISNNNNKIIIKSKVK